MKNGKLNLFLSTSIAMALAGCATTEIDNTIGSINPAGSVAPLKVASVDSSVHDGNGPDRLIDGDLKTRWSASGDNSFAVIDYGQVAEFDAVRLAFHKGNTRASKFDIQSSVDGKTWTDVIVGAQSSGAVLTLERFSFKALKARYFKYIGHGNTSNMWNSVNEFNAVNCDINTCLSSELTSADLGPTGLVNAIGGEAPLKVAAVESSAHDGNGPDRLIDGDIKTRWSASGDNSYAVLDYGKVSEFDAVRLAFHKGDKRASKFDIQVSENGQDWTDVLVGVQASGAVLSIERFPFPAVKARYVKYIGHGNTSNMWNSVNEFNAVNCKVNTCLANELITSDIVAKAAVPKVKLETNKGPASKIENWKITIPVTNASLYGSSAAVKAYYALQGTGPDSAAEILPGNCSADKSSLSMDTKNPYFSADKKGWHFRVPLEGGTTTPNSTYIRSEFRELANDWQPCQPSGEANWSYGGSHMLASTLTINEIPATPLKKDGISKSDPKVVLGQIHAKDVHAATVKLLWEGKNKPVRVILNKSTEKSAFSVKLGKIKDPSKPWTYIIKMTDAGIELAAGGVRKKLKFGKELDNAWKDEKFYFKAGLYPQVSKDSGGAFDATFTKISIEHKKRAGDFGTHVPLACDKAVSDCSKAVWWDVPLQSPTIPATPLASNKPGQNFDLTTWYLSQPFDHDKNGKPDDVNAWYLAQGYEHPEMFYTADDGGLVFKSFIKGVRTSKNTKYVRTELREMLRRGDESIPLKGVTKNNWVFSSAPQADLEAAGAIDGIMNATLKIDHTTSTGELNQVGRFIIGQIHDKDDEPIRLYYRKLPTQKTGTVYFAHENTRLGTDVFYDLVGGFNGITEDGIALGEVFSYQIKVVGNTMTVTLMREGKKDAVQVVDMTESGYDVGGRYMYFKAGVYNQNNSGDPEDYVQATFYKLETSHSQYKK